MDAATLERINLLPRAQAISVGDSVFTEEQRQLIADVYKSLLGKDIRNCSCRHRYSDALEEICLTLKIKKKMRKYQLKAGMVIWLGTECYTNVNLTDEVAKAYLEKFPQAREKEFQAWPDENEEKNAEKLQAAKETLKDSEEGLKESEPRLKEESVADIIAHQNTLKEAIEGGDIDSIIAAEAGLKDAWEHAEAKPEKPAEAPTPETDDGQGQDLAPTPELTESEGKEPEPEPTPETEKPKTKKGK